MIGKKHNGRRGEGMPLLDTTFDSDDDDSRRGLDDADVGIVDIGDDKVSLIVCICMHVILIEYSCVCIS